MSDGKQDWQPIWPNRSGLVVGSDAKSLVATDVNGDAAPDFIVGVNNGFLRAFESAVRGEGQRSLVVRLKGPLGNPTAIGARVKMLDNGRIQTREVASTEGYLSQRRSELTFAVVDENTESVELEVTWPGGEKTQEVFQLDAIAPVTHHESNWPVRAETQH